MAIKPILFNTEMVRAILDGRKSCTRRLIKFSKNKFTGKIPNPQDVSLCELKSEKANFAEQPFYGFAVKLPYKLGDILYVRETWHKYTKRIGKGESCCLAEFYGYKASVANSEDAEEPWKPSIHMPKEAARIWLKVTDVRVERLQDITEDGAKAEGAKQCYEQINTIENKPVTYLAEDYKGYYVLGFKSVWNSTIKKSDIDRYGWDANPWVWVIEFERCEKPEI